MADAGCAGILVADTFCGPMAALPDAGQLMALAAMPSKPGGCAANVAIDLAKQGASVDVAGCVGDDAAAQLVLAGLKAHGVCCEGVVVTEHHPTSTTVILLVEGQDRRYLHVFGANRAFTAVQVDRQWISGLKVFYLGGLFAMPALEAAPLADLLGHCRRSGVTTVVDVVLPADANVVQARDDLAQLLPLIDYFVPNQDEARLLTGQVEARDQAAVLRTGGAGAVVITRGAGGAYAARGSQCWSCPTFATQVVDPSGSGDAFAAGLITGILRGWDMDQTLRYGAALGASATRAVGTTDGVFTAAEAAAFLDTHPLNQEHP